MENLENKILSNDTGNEGSMSVQEVKEYGDNYMKRLKEIREKEKNDEGTGSETGTEGVPEGTGSETGTEGVPEGTGSEIEGTGNESIGDL